MFPLPKSPHSRELQDIHGRPIFSLRPCCARTTGPIHHYTRRQRTVTFIPNGKMRVESVFNPSTTDEHEKSIVFDGERGTMKVSGGPQSPFAQRIADQIQFWVRDKGCIPGFLAALTLEFYEEHTRAVGR